MELGHFNKGIFQICGLFDMGTLKHRDVSAQRYFGTMEVLAQDRLLRQSAKISLLRIIKTNHMYLVYKTFQGRNLSNFFGGILENL